MVGYSVHRAFESCSATGEKLKCKEITPSLALGWGLVLAVLPTVLPSEGDPECLM
jgi:hypothetical protein